MRKSLLPLLVLFAACDPADEALYELEAEDAEFDDELEWDADEDLVAQTAPAAADENEVWDPKNIPENLCGDPDEPLSLPPDPSGSCDIEVRVKNTEFTEGQGISEGKGEMSTVVTASVSVPAPAETSANIPNSGYLIYSAGESKYHGRVLETYTVPVGQTLNVEVCADFTEHDFGGTNGDDDLGSQCGNLMLQCDPSNGQPSYTMTLGPTDLCGPNQCNGKAAATIKVMRADADQDGVENDDDFTPEPCDEHEKGENGVALLQYFHYDDDGFTTLAQSVGADLSRPYPAYDFKVLLIDNDTSNPMGVNNKAITEADLTFPPTRRGLLDAMQVLTAEGYRFDSIVHAHGYKRNANDAKFEVLQGNMITGKWLVDATEPDKVGTARGGIPLMAWWSTTCIAARQIDAWIEIGGLVASGAEDVQFYPNAFHNYVDNWLAGQAYDNAVHNSVTSGVVDAAELVIQAESLLDPWFCIGDGVLGTNDCAEDFFNDDEGANEARYNISDVYDHSLSGAENMALSSERSFLGITGLRFGAGIYSWP